MHWETHSPCAETKGQQYVSQEATRSSKPGSLNSHKVAEWLLGM